MSLISSWLYIPSKKIGIHYPKIVLRCLDRARDSGQGGRYDSALKGTEEGRDSETGEDSPEAPAAFRLLLLRGRTV